MAHNLGILSGTQRRDHHLINMALDPAFGLIEHLEPTILIRNPQTLKVRATKDPDTPNLRDAMSGPHKTEFLEAMVKEIKDLEEHGTWEVIMRNEIPKTEGVLPHIIPSAWAFKIKCHPDGRLRKFKGRFCVRGDQQIE